MKPTPVNSPGLPTWEDFTAFQRTPATRSDTFNPDYSFAKEQVNTALESLTREVNIHGKEAAHSSRASALVNTIKDHLDLLETLLWPKTLDAIVGGTQQLRILCETVEFLAQELPEWDGSRLSHLLRYNLATMRSPTPTSQVAPAH